MNQKRIVLKVKHALVIYWGWQLAEGPKTEFYQELKKLEFIEGQIDWEAKARFNESKQNFTLSGEETAFVFDAIEHYVGGMILHPIKAGMEGAKTGSWKFHLKEGAEDYSLEEHLQNERECTPDNLKEALDTLYYFTHQVHPKPKKTN